ncbi:MAG: flagellar protein FlaG [Alkalispirochaeta sp.]
MEVTQVLQGTRTTGSRDTARSIEQVRRAFATYADDQVQQREEKISREKVKQLTQELQEVMRAFNKRLSFDYNEQLEQMVVKVIDRETDTVIKELPPSELQRVHLRIREAIGLLLDESV